MKKYPGTGDFIIIACNDAAGIQAQWNLGGRDVGDAPVNWFARCSLKSVWAAKVKVEIIRRTETIRPCLKC
jgi:hypothetical protein